MMCYLSTRLIFALIIDNDQELVKRIISEENAKEEHLRGNNRQHTKEKTEMGDDSINKVSEEVTKQQNSEQEKTYGYP